MKRAIFFVLVISVCTITRTQNLVINPGFESWETTSKPIGWTAHNCTKESTAFLSGSFSCLQSGGTSSSMDLSQKIAVTPGKTYSLTINYMTSPVSEGNGGRLWCRWVDGAGTLFDDAATEGDMQSGYLVSTTWKSLTISITAPPAAVSINLLIRTLSNSVTYWDDISFMEGLPTLADEDEFAALRIYPIPAGEYLNLENIAGINRIEIMNLYGSVLKSAGVSGQTRFTIFTGDLSEGIYVIRLTDENSRIIMRKFIR